MNPEILTAHVGYFIELHKTKLDVCVSLLHDQIENKIFKRELFEHRRIRILKSHNKIVLEALRSLNY